MPAGPGPMGLGLLAFLALWSVMMAAMMLPAVAPTAALYAGSITAGSAGAARTARTGCMVVGYLSVWSLVGLLAYAATLAGSWMARAHPGGAAWTASALFAATAAYQLSPLRARCLAHCRAPFALLFRMTSRSGPLRDLRAGMLHGAVCTACCLPLMACLVALGTMSVGWMLALTGVVVAERHRVHGSRVTRVAAAALLVMAVAVPLHPQLATGLHAPAAPMGM